MQRYKNICFPSVVGLLNNAKMIYALHKKRRPNNGTPLNIIE